MVQASSGSTEEGGLRFRVLQLFGKGGGVQRRGNYDFGYYSFVRANPPPFPQKL